MNATRVMRVNDEIQKELSEIIRQELKDPRLGAMITVVRVDTTKDLSLAKIYVSVLGDDAAKSEAMKGLSSAGGFIRKLIAERVNLRVTPELKFILDDSLEQGIRLTKLIEEVNK